jgi:hypothetical protein
MYSNHLRTAQMIRAFDDSEVTIASLRKELNTLDWSSRNTAHAAAAETFAIVGPDHLMAAFGTSLPSSVDVNKSVEKTSHYKWFLGGPPDESFELWLHEYKPRDLRREGHATVAHNHRFWLSSLLLRGGFTDSRYRRDESSPSLLKRIGSRRLAPGDAMVIDADEIHSLSDLEDGTITLVVQSAPVRSYSEVFENGSMKVYFDLEARLTELGESLRGER